MKGAKPYTIAKMQQLLLSVTVAKPVGIGSKLVLVHVTGALLLVPVYLPPPLTFPPLHVCPPPSFYGDRLAKHLVVYADLQHLHEGVVDASDQLILVFDIK